MTQLIQYQPNELLSADDIAQLNTLSDLYQDALVDTCFADYQQSLSDNTLKRQQNDLELFATFLRTGTTLTIKGSMLYSKPEAWTHIKASLVETFKRYLVNTEHDLHSINVHLSTIRSYAKLAFRCGVMSEYQYLQIKAVNGFAQRETVNIDSKRESTRRGHKKEHFNVVAKHKVGMMKQLDATKPNQVRDRLLLVLFLDHGFRVSEVAELKIGNVNLIDRTIAFWRPKVKGWDKHALTDDSFAVLTEYMQLVDIDQPESLLIKGSNKSGRLLESGMSERAINKRIGEIGEQFGIPNLSPHDLRHTAVTEVIKHNSMDKVMALFGWTSPAMAIRYAKKSSIGNEGVTITY